MPVCCVINLTLKYVKCFKEFYQNSASEKFTQEKRYSQDYQLYEI